MRKVVLGIVACGIVMVGPARADGEAKTGAQKIKALGCI